MTMRILHLAPLWYPIAKDAPGGIETFLAELIFAQVEAGSVVSVVASADTQTAAHLIPIVAGGLVQTIRAAEAAEYQYYEQHLLQTALLHGEQYDIIHSHSWRCGLRVIWHSRMESPRIAHPSTAPVLRRHAIIFPNSS